ncbi:hypothetical protein C8R45DRAFT_1176696 [Mycena sanguinolenta]|nr:hypothetical protein C8R45DRAFT_1176696 [Mycena sanguinolenta]
MSAAYLSALLGVELDAGNFESSSCQKETRELASALFEQESTQMSPNGVALRKTEKLGERRRKRLMAASPGQALPQLLSSSPVITPRAAADGSDFLWPGKGECRYNWARAPEPGWGIPIWESEDGMGHWPSPPRCQDPLSVLLIQTLLSYWNHRSATRFCQPDPILHGSWLGSTRRSTLPLGPPLPHLSPPTSHFTGVPGFFPALLSPLTRPSPCLSASFPSPPTDLAVWATGIQFRLSVAKF